MIGLLMALPGKPAPDDGALGGAQDDIVAAGDPCRHGSGGERHEGGLKQKPPDHD
jgi:hypothetical protein